MSSKIAIQVQNLSKCYQIYQRPQDRLLQMLPFNHRQYYDEFWALRDVSFTIQTGETVGIIGRNGSGKSTLLQMICGTVSPTQGTIQTNGRIAALLELGAGFNTEFTGRENIVLNASILGFSQQDINHRMDDILSFSELGSFIDQPVKTYSSGMFARLAFSIAIHVDPDILVVDEALAVGDAKFVAKCMRRIKDLQKSGVTILFVSHDVGSVRTLCDRAIWLDRGELRNDGDVFPVTGQYTEYMFQDEPSEQDILSEQIQQQMVDEPSISTTNTLPVDSRVDDIIHESSSNSDISNFARPVTHWGSHQGIIKSVHLLNHQGTHKDVIMWDEDVEIVINLLIPLSIPRESLSIAFSIKDLKGTDLLVSTTHDFNKDATPSIENFSVHFRFRNQLTTGKYLIVAAVENREYSDIHYYEYIEGAHYFSSLADQRLFGIFHQPITQQIQINES